MLSRITLMMGIAPPTEASNRICRPNWSARSKSGRSSVRQQLLVRCDHVAAGAQRALDEREGPLGAADQLHDDRDGRIVQNPLEVTGEDVGRSVDPCPAEVLLDDVSHPQVDPRGIEDASCSFWITAYTLDPMVPKPSRAMVATFTSSAFAYPTAASYPCSGRWRATRSA